MQGSARRTLSGHGMDCPPKVTEQASLSHAGFRESAVTERGSLLEPLRHLILLAHHAPTYPSQDGPYAR